MPVYVSRYAAFQHGDVQFHPQGAEADDHDACVAACGENYGASYDERLAGVESPDFVVLESAADRAEAAAAAEAEAEAKKHAAKKPVAKHAAKPSTRK